ncbi:hypothetical protein CIW47_05250 [Mycolicibacterium sp. P1-5]|nr:hypothetical protein CIW47_05250 [Mycolicibacterium sp. P1-5]
MPKPEAPAAKTYSDQEVADAKKAVCDAFQNVIHTLDANKRKSSVNPADSFAVAVNTRLAVETAADYLAQAVDSHPALPSDLLSKISDLANAYRGIVMKQIGDADQGELDKSYQQADALQTASGQACQ